MAALTATSVVHGGSASAATALGGDQPRVTHGSSSVRPHAVPTATSGPTARATATPDPKLGWLGLSSEPCDPAVEWNTYRTTVRKANEDFVSMGAIFTSNRTSSPVPLAQTLSKTQSFTATANAKFSGGFSGVQAELGGSVEYSVEWTTGQEIGPFDVKPGTTARATYGWDVIRWSGVQQRCSAFKRWTMPAEVNGIAPVQDHVVLDTYPIGKGSPAVPGTSYAAAMNGQRVIGR